ncbi:MAG: aspartate kinase [Sandaracinus sp.]|nr:aspartate kinase [Sandaracinus sp.]
MPIVVQKYGGSSVADVDKLQRVAEKVVASKRAGNDVVVVVSAMGKTTDQLLALAHQVDSSPPRRELDMLVSTGERVSMALLSMAIQKHGVDAISFTGSQSGIITNDRHFDARIIEVRPHRIEDELARGKVVIIAGFQGMSYKREITTLGRGGSDTTALAMAAALGAEHAEIYSDVDGVYSADPRKVEGARHLPELTYDEMQAMAEAGAKVLHAQAVEAAREARIRIHARSTFATTGRETVVRGDAGAAAGAVVGLDRLAQVRVPGADPGALLGFLQSASVRPIQLVADPSEVRFEVATGAVPDWSGVRDALEGTHGAEVADGLGAATYVGREAAAKGAEVLAAVAELGIRPRRVKVEALSAGVVVDGDRLDEVVQALHDRLVGPV